MKTVGPLLVIAAVCCFAPAMSNVIKDGKDEQGSAAGTSCLQKAMNNNKKIVDSLIYLICVYKRSKGMSEKQELIKAIQKLEDDTGCPIEDISGTSKSPEQVAMDENDVLTSMINTLMRLLKQHDIYPTSVHDVCSLKNNVMSTDSVTQASKEEAGQGNKRTTRDLLNILSLLAGGKKQGNILENTFRPLGSPVGRTNINSELGVAGQRTQGLGGLVNRLSGLLILNNLLGRGLEDPLSGLTNRFSGLTGSLGQMPQDLIGLTGDLTGGLLSGGVAGNILG